MVNARQAEEQWFITGRVLDHLGRPVVDADVGGALHVASRGSRGKQVTTDEQGRFHVPIPIHARGGVEASLTIRLPMPDSDDPEQSLKTPRATIDLTDLHEPGVYDLGDVVLEMPLLGRLEGDSPMSDEELAEALRCRLDGVEGCCYGIVYEACLREAVARGRARCEAFLRELCGDLERTRTEEDDYPYERRFLPALIALRRVQGKRDPLALEIQGPSEITLPFPEHPILRYALVNVDEEGESFPLSRGGNYRSGRFTRCRIDGLDPDGNPVEVLPDRGGFGGGMYSVVLLEPGEREELSIPIASYIRVARPGVNLLRVQYHDHETIAGRRSVEHLLVTTSDPVRVQWTPRTVVLSEARERELRGRIDELDDLALPWIVEFSYHEEIEPTLPDDGSAAEILRAGWEALPVLLEAVADPAITPARRAWLLALLFDLTGVLDPSGVEGVLGQAERIPGWRGSRVFPLFDPWFSPPGGGPSREAQQSLVEAWSELASLVRVERTR